MVSQRRHVGHIVPCWLMVLTIACKLQPLLAAVATTDARQRCGFQDAASRHLQRSSMNVDLHKHFVARVAGGAMLVQLVKARLELRRNAQMPFALDASVPPQLPTLLRRHRERTANSSVVVCKTQT